MIQCLFSIKDTKSEFWRPFTHHNEQTATREFDLMVNSGDNPVSQTPADYELWYVGTFDTTTGITVSDVKFIVGGASLKKVMDA